MDGASSRIPHHMNLQIPSHLSVRTITRLKEQNRQLTQEVSDCSHRVTQLETEKAMLLRQLFHQKSVHLSEETVYMWWDGRWLSGQVTFSLQLKKLSLVWSWSKFCPRLDTYNLQNFPKLCAFWQKVFHNFWFGVLVRSGTCPPKYWYYQFRKKKL